MVIGSINTALFNSIDWSTGSKFLEVEIDGSSVGNTEMQAVPYALHSKNAAGLGGIPIGTTPSIGEALIYNGTNWIGVDNSNRENKSQKITTSPALVSY